MTTYRFLLGHAFLFLWVGLRTAYGEGLGPATVTSYEFTTIDVPGAYRTEANGINDAGQIVGFFFDATGQHGFLKDGDNYAVFDVGLDGTSAFGINDVQQIVGYASGLGFLKDGDNVESIAVPSSNFTVARGINNSGGIAGTFNDDLGTHGFFKDGDNITPIDGPDALFTEATGINDSGEIVGNFTSSAGSFQAFSISDGLLSVIQAPDATVTEAGDINQLGHVVGSFVDPDGVVHGFVMSDSRFSIIDAPDAASPNFTQAKGINDSGHVVGWFDKGGGEVHGFLAIPVGMTVVAIDIEPGNKQNAFNPRSRRQIRVGILSDIDAAHPFDPTSQVDTSTVKFGPKGARPTQFKLRDINKDGLLDLVLQFQLKNAGIKCGQRKVRLTGATFSGQQFRGSDNITTLGCK